MPVPVQGIEEPLHIRPAFLSFLANLGPKFSPQFPNLGTVFRAAPLNGRRQPEERGHKHCEKRGANTGKRRHYSPDLSAHSLLQTREAS